MLTHSMRRLMGLKIVVQASSALNGLDRSEGSDPAGLVVGTVLEFVVHLLKCDCGFAGYPQKANGFFVQRQSVVSP